MNKITLNSIISILFIFSTLLFAKTVGPTEEVLDENYIINNIDSNSMVKEWNDYQINDNNELDKNSKVDFEDNENIIEQPECSIVRNNN